MDKYLVQQKTQNKTLNMICVFVDCVNVYCMNRFSYDVADVLHFRSDLARSYRAKLSEMELKQTEVMRISQDFENKMRQKEVRIVGIHGYWMPLTSISQFAEIF